MSHLLLNEFIAEIAWFGLIPIGRRKQEQIPSVSICLPRLEHGLRPRNLVASMPV